MFILDTINWRRRAAPLLFLSAGQTRGLREAMFVLPPIICIRDTNSGRTRTVRVGLKRSSVYDTARCHWCSRLFHSKRQHRLFADCFAEFSCESCPGFFFFFGVVDFLVCWGYRAVP